MYRGDKSPYQNKNRHFFFFQTFLKRRDFYQKDNFINSVSKWCVQSKLLYNKGRFSILPLFLWQSIFHKDIFESSFFFFFLYYTFFFSYGVFLAGLKEQMILFRLILNIQKYKQYLNFSFLYNSLHWQVIVYKGCRNK